MSVLLQPGDPVEFTVAASSSDGVKNNRSSKLTKLIAKQVVCHRLYPSQLLLPHIKLQKKMSSACGTINGCLDHIYRSVSQVKKLPISAVMAVTVSDKQQKGVVERPLAGANSASWSSRVGIINISSSGRCVLPVALPDETQSEDSAWSCPCCCPCLLLHASMLFTHSCHPSSVFSCVGYTVCRRRLVAALALSAMLTLTPL